MISPWLKRKAHGVTAASHDGVLVTGLVTAKLSEREKTLGAVPYVLRHRVLCD